jgi:hypothetical protein
MSGFFVSTRKLGRTAIVNSSERRLVILKGNYPKLFKQLC